MSGDFPWPHVPGEMAPVPDRETKTPPLDDDDLIGLLDDLAGIHPGIDQIRDGARHLAVDTLTADQTQTVITSIAGTGTDVLTLLALLIQRLTHPDQPALRHLEPDTRKAIQLCGEQYAHETAEYAPREHPCEAAALIDGIRPPSPRGPARQPTTSRTPHPLQPKGARPMNTHTRFTTTSSPPATTSASGTPRTAATRT